MARRDEPCEPRGETLPFEAVGPDSLRRTSSTVAGQTLDVRCRCPNGERVDKLESRSVAASRPLGWSR
jgi:hypothetical protein